MAAFASLKLTGSVLLRARFDYMMAAMTLGLGLVCNTNATALKACYQLTETWDLGTGNQHALPCFCRGSARHHKIAIFQRFKSTTAHAGLEDWQHAGCTIFELVAKLLQLRFEIRLSNLKQLLGQRCLGPYGTSLQLCLK